MKRFVKKPARLVLNRLGLEVVPRRVNVPTPTTPLGHPFDANYRHGDIAFEVPLEKCMYPYHFSYSPAGWHPFVQVLRQYGANPDLNYENSSLYAYYQAYQPDTVLEAFFVDTETRTEFASSKLADFKIPPHQPFFPWDPHASETAAEKGLDASQGNQGYGPVSDAKGTLEFERLTHTYESIKTHGFKTGLGHDGDVRGYFLKSDDDYRFVIRQGLHRTAVLSAMDYEKIRVRFFDPYPRTIFLNDLDNWPQVKEGTVSTTLAKRIFNLFFEDDGCAKAEALGLL
ncbi:hypothetical protein BH24DEI2_BH24DEI2_06670 [soil metagenome]